MALTSQQTEELLYAIDQRRNVLFAEIRQDVDKWRAEQFNELAGPAPDAGDESVAQLISDLDRADLSRDIGELRALEAARERMAAGSYGVCAECGGEIAFGRLRAEPGALRCVDCQSRHEKTYGGSGGSKL
jgi:RNA polymerase-binding transcription factor